MSLTKFFLVLTLAIALPQASIGKAPPTVQFDAVVVEVTGDSSVWPTSLAAGDPITASLIPRQVAVGAGFTYRRDLELVLPGGELLSPWYRISIFDVFGVDSSGTYNGIEVGCQSQTESPYCFMGRLDDSPAPYWTSTLSLFGERITHEISGGQLSTERLNLYDVTRELRLEFREQYGLGSPVLSVVAEVGIVSSIPEPSSLVLALAALAVSACRPSTPSFR